jgi:hypothetical protein
VTITGGKAGLNFNYIKPYYDKYGGYSFIHEEKIDYVNKLKDSF